MNREKTNAASSRAPGVEQELTAQGLDTEIAQESLSFNRRRGTLRGLHFQRSPHEEIKIVRCTRGAIFDVIVDLRPRSPTYLRWQGFELTADNRRAIYVPGGFAHGFQTLIDEVEVAYQISAFYVPEAAGGYRHDEASLQHRLAAASDRDQRARPRLAASFDAEALKVS